MRNLLVVLWLLVAPAAFAFEPDEGWYWNPAEPGRGYNIESQNGFMFVASFVYAPSGAATWYTSQGTYNRSTRTFTATLDAFTGGQCLGCAARAPSAGATGGPMSITWDTAVSATLTFNGGTTRIQRFIVNYPTLNSYLYGDWAMTDQVSSLVTGEWIVFNGRMTDSHGVEFITGHRDNGTSIAVGNFDPSLHLFAVLLDSSTSYYRFYAFDMTDSRMEGRAYLYLKTSSPSGSGNLFFGFRLAEASVLGIPRQQRLEKAQPARDRLDDDTYAAMSHDGPASYVNAKGETIDVSSIASELQRQIGELASASR